jgi:hypothetical protein
MADNLPDGIKDIFALQLIKSLVNKRGLFLPSSMASTLHHCSIFGRKELYFRRRKWAARFGMLRYCHKP